MKLSINTTVTKTRYMQRSISVVAHFLVGLLCLMNCQAAEMPKIERWDRYEITLKGPATGNPYSDVILKATFSNGADKVTVTGFYDGDGVYKIRFMPAKTGIWNCVTFSNSALLKNKHGSFQCVTAAGSNHGMVRVFLKRMARPPGANLRRILLTPGT